MFPSNLGPGELLVVGLVAVLLFGKRLPEVGRSLGKGITEFKKGLRGEDQDAHGDSHSVLRSPSETSSQMVPQDYEVPKFEPPVHPPVMEPSHTPPYSG